MSQVILFESDWWFHILTVLVYLAFNYAVSEFTGRPDPYQLDWEIVSNITPFSPVFGSIVYMIVAVTNHFLLCMVT